MRRIVGTARDGWQKIVEGQGLIYHHTQGRPYWDESVHYEFSAAQVDVLEAATNELQARCLDAGQVIIDQNRFAEFGIPESAVPHIVKTWNDEPPAIYGRFDFIYDGINPPKMLEYNADTPTALIEAAVIQWFWKEDVFKGSDQFNSIHERLVAKWKELKSYLNGTMYFASMPHKHAEDLMNTSYLRSTAIEADLETDALFMTDIGWDGARLVDLADQPIRSIFKLYPWEWLIHEKFGAHALDTMGDVQWMEPIWKMMWSNKALSALLWELFPNHPNLLPTFYDDHGIASFVKKPKLSREGGNVEVVRNGQTVTANDGDYGAEGFVFQQFVEPVNEFHPIIGSWVIDGQSAGIGIRESSELVTGNSCRFVPHLFR